MMDALVEVFKAWTSLPVRKMLITLGMIIVVGGGYSYDRYWNRFQWLTPIEVSSELLVTQLKTTPFDYVGVFKYSYEIPYQVVELQEACSSSTDICYRSKDYFLHDNLSQVVYHMQNLCYVASDSSGNSDGMKIVGSCPIIKDKKLKGYVTAASTLNADRKDLETFLRKTAEIITTK